ncbi:hypothetical protein ACS0TY_027536 [Phlomoides rotata]
MDGSGSGGLGDGEKGKNVRSRRSWTKIEEDALVLCLIEIVNNGWKSDNGFRAGFQRELEKGMRALIPDIFGRDRATGEHAAAAIDIVNDMLRYSETGESASVDKVLPADHVPEQVEENTPISKVANTAVKKGKGIKRKPVETEMTALVSTLGQFMKSSDDTFGSIAQKMGNEQEAKVARTTLNDIMKQIPGLSLHDKKKVSDELIQNNNRLEYFLSLPPDEQAEYVIMLLDGHLK